MYHILGQQRLSLCRRLLSINLMPPLYQSFFYIDGRPWPGNWGWMEVKLPYEPSCPSVCRSVRPLAFHDFKFTSHAVIIAYLTSKDISKPCNFNSMSGKGGTGGIIGVEAVPLMHPIRCWEEIRVQREEYRRVEILRIENRARQWKNLAEIRLAGKPELPGPPNQNIQAPN